MTREEVILELEQWLAESPGLALEHETTGEVITIPELIQQIREQRGFGEELYKFLCEKYRKSLN